MLHNIHCLRNYLVCHENGNDFYSTARLNSCLEYLLDNECYALLAAQVVYGKGPDTKLDEILLKFIFKKIRNSINMAQILTVGF